jgi:hypothetical protein
MKEFLNNLNVVKKIYVNSWRSKVQIINVETIIKKIGSILMNFFNYSN